MSAKMACDDEEEKRGEKERGRTHFSRPHLTTPASRSMTPTYRSTLPSFSASARSCSNSASWSGRRRTNSSPVLQSASAEGMSVSVSSEA